MVHPSRETLPDHVPSPADAGVIGNGETTAIVGPHGAVTWWCVPALDGYPIFAWALDPGRGGYLDVAPDPPGPFVHRLKQAQQAYYEGTNVLVTRLETPHGPVALVDFLPWQRAALVREVWTSGTLSLRVTLAVTRAAVAGAWKAAGGFPFALHSGEAAVALALESSGLAGLDRGSWPQGGGELPAWDAERSLLQWRWTVTGTPGASGPLPAGSCAPQHPLLQGLHPAGRLAVGYAKHVEAARRAAAALVRLSPAEVIAADREWLGHADRPSSLSPAHRQAVDRSLLVLRTLTYPRTGAIVAAATASWPATPGGDQNWDYRFVWLRDGSWTALALDRLGFHREARAFYRFALGLQGSDGHWAQPLYTIDGRLPYEAVAPELSGPRGERPVRFGNAAAHQLQLDNEGNVLLGIAWHGVLTDDAAFLWEAWDGVSRAARWLEANWQREESGIWELRGRTAHWLYGKAMVAAGLLSAAAIARRLGTGLDDARRWEALAGRIADEAHARAWSPARGAWMRIYFERGPGEDEPMDISVLAAPIWGLVEPRDPRVAATLRAIRQPRALGGLVVDGGVYRFADGDLPFFMAGFWLVRALARAGQREAAWRLFEELASGTNPLGLMAEHHDPATRAQHGNFPQAFSHEELIHAALELYEPERFIPLGPSGSPRPAAPAP